jgi:Peptidase_C39 like family
MSQFGLLTLRLVKHIVVPLRMVPRLAPSPVLTPLDYSALLLTLNAMSSILASSHKGAFPMPQKIHSRKRKLFPGITALLLLSVAILFQVLIETHVSAVPIGEQDFGPSKVVINFDSLGNGTPVSTQFQNLGVTFSNEFSGSPVARVTGGARSQPTYLCGAAAGRPDEFNADIFLTFATPVTALGGDIANGTIGGDFLTVFGPNGETETVSNVAGAVHQFIAVRPSFPIVRAQFGGTFFCIDDVTFERGCTTNVQRLSQGGNAPWANEQYDSINKTISQKGCALTSLSMALNFAGLANDPSSLNKFMIETDNDYNGSSVNWGPATRDRSNETLVFNGFRSRSTQALDDALCQGFPVIVGVDFNAEDVPGHFVVVTGKQGDTYTIADPGFAGRTTLDSYDNKFETRGYVRKTDASNSSTANSTFTNLLSRQNENLGELDVAVGDNAELLVVNASGLRAGFDFSAKTILEEIAGSSYFRDSLNDDETGEPAEETGHIVQIKEPAEEAYRIDVIGVKRGTSTLSIRAFSQDGSPQPPIVIQGITGIGSTSTFQLVLGPGATPIVIRTATVESTLNDIRNSLDLSLIDNAGIAQALSSKLMAAQAAFARGNSQAAGQILEAFKAEVRAQESKHVNSLVVQVLLEDADFLRGQMAQ